MRVFCGHIWLCGCERVCDVVYIINGPPRALYIYLWGAADDGLRFVVRSASTEPQMFGAAHKSLNNPLLIIGRRFGIAETQTGHTMCARRAAQRLKAYIYINICV